MSNLPGWSVDESGAYMHYISRDIQKNGVPAWARTINVTVEEFFQIRSSWDFVERSRFANNRATFHGLLVRVVAPDDFESRYSEEEPPIQVRIVADESLRYRLQNATSGWTCGTTYGLYEWAVAKARREGWEVVSWEDNRGW